MRNALLAIAILASSAWGLTTITFQDIPSDWVIAVEKTQAELRSEACGQLPCLRYNSTDYDLYTATGTATGSWRNTRTGMGP